MQTQLCNCDTPRDNYHLFFFFPTRHDGQSPYILQTPQELHHQAKKWSDSSLTETEPYALQQYIYIYIDINKTQVGRTKPGL